MSQTVPAGPIRLHHHATVTDDQEATRRFYEDVIGMPLVATWTESDVLFGAERVYCHTFYALADGSSLAFFQFADPADQELFKTEINFTPFRHIALAVDKDTQQAIKQRIAAAGYVEPDTFVLDHGYCVSLYVTDPNGLIVEFSVDHPDVALINAERQKSAHEDLARWLGGDHSSNNTYR
ncbi:MAG TPA: VOC family protein [Acidimicrobiales bacterium]|jgi:catechol 2,3-dioxygenase-like lactoylglutathione lyase family enzyme